MRLLKREAWSRLLAAVAASLLCAPAVGQIVEDRPDELQNVGIDPKLGAQVPLDLKFQDENSQVLSLADVFDGERPILLTLNYSDCPMLCRVQLDALVETLKEMEWTTGREFDVVSVSINPLETPTRARQTEKKYLQQYERAGAASGWRFLVGPEENIQELADAVGFKYEYVPDRQEYAHTAALMVMTPEGVVSRYFYGVLYEPKTLRLSMVEAAEGRVGSLTDQILLFCFHYDETKGRYGPAARRIMSLGAGVTVLVLAVTLIPYWLTRGGPKKDLTGGGSDAAASKATASEADAAAPAELATADS
ncbi:MAG: SCO family protein [Planctomycetota bacterium]